MSINRAFGLTLLQFLVKKKMSKLEFANGTGISRSTLYKILDGKQSPSLDTIYLFSQYLQTSPGKLVSSANQLMQSENKKAN